MHESDGSRAQAAMFCALSILTWFFVLGTFGASAQGLIFNTVADLNAASVASGVNSVSTLGYHTIGDGGGTSYVRVGTAPALSCSQTSNAGSTFWDFKDRSTVNVKWCGAYGDSSHDDYNAIIQSISALTSRGGTVFFPVGNFLVGSTISILDKKYISFVGPGSGDAPSFGDAVATLTYTPASGSFLHLDGTQAIKFSNLVLMYNSPTYAGTFINLRHSLGAVITDFTLFENFSIQGTNASSKNANLVDVGMTINTYFKNGNMQNGNVPIIGAIGSGDFSNGLYVDGVLFNRKLSLGPIVGGTNWSFKKCIFEPLRGDTVAWGFGATSYGVVGLNISDSQFDDAQGSGTWIDFFNNVGWGTPGQITGVTIESNFFQGAGTAIRPGKIVGGSIVNNSFQQPLQYPILNANLAKKLSIKNNYIGTSAGPGVGLMIFGGFPTDGSEVDNNDGNGIIFGPTGNNYVTLPGRKLMAWGQASGIGNIYTAVSFGATFGSAPVVTATEVGVSTPAPASVSSISTTGFTAAVTGSAASINWVAIGSAP